MQVFACSWTNTCAEPSLICWVGSNAVTAELKHRAVRFSPDDDVAVAANTLPVSVILVFHLLQLPAEDSTQQQDVQVHLGPLETSAQSLQVLDDARLTSLGAFPCVNVTVSLQLRPPLPKQHEGWAGWC